MKLAVIFGGKSTEHEVSIISGMSIIKNLNKEKYNIKPTYIDEQCNWYQLNLEEVAFKMGERPKKHNKIENVLEYLKEFDLIFPVLHGKNGEDGTIQGLFEIIGVPYVGCGVLSSSVGMDKAYTKIIFEKANLQQAPYMYIRKHKDKYIIIDEKMNEEQLYIQDICKKISQNLRYPVFVKPSNAGSSVGINKVKEEKDLIKAIECATQFDKKIVIEQGIQGREIECAVLGNEEVIASGVGEVIPADEFYSFEAKYHNTQSKCIIPAQINRETVEKIRKLAVKAFKAIDGRGLSRVDFFLKENGEIIINEINTLPGFTEISMYSKLWEESGIKYSELLEKLIALAIEK